MFDTLRESMGWSPTKQHNPLPPVSGPSTPRTDRGGHRAPAPREPSIWGYLDVENRKGKVTGGLPILERDFTIGRASDNDVRLCEIGVSRHACRIRFETPGNARLYLLGSNKVSINDEQVLPIPDSDEPASASLSSRDLLTIQKYRFRFRYNDEHDGSADMCVPLSPREHGRSSIAPLATPSGKQRRVRMSLVRAAAINTPSKPENHAPHEDYKDGEEEGRAALTGPGSLRSHAAAREATPSDRPTLDVTTPDRSGRTRAAEDEEGRVDDQRVVLFDSPATLTPAGRDNLRDLLGELGRQGESSEDEDDVQEHVLVIDDPEGMGGDAGSADEGMDRAQIDEQDGAAEVISPRTDLASDQKSEDPKPPRRRSSFLSLAWPFGRSGQSSSEAERPMEASSALESGLEGLRISGPEAVTDMFSNSDEAAEIESEDLCEELPDLGGTTPRLPSSASSPGRLNSPSFNYHGRRNISLRTKTLLRSSAALAEKLEQETLESSDASDEARSSPSTSPELGGVETEEPCTPLESQQPAAETHTPEETEENEVDQSLSIVEDLGPLPQFPPSSAVELPSADRSAASKRLSMPAGSRRGFFGLLPVIRPSKEAEDVINRMGSTRERQDDPPSRRLSAQSVGDASAHETLKQPARETVRYLLAKGPRTVVSEPPSVVGTPVASTAAPTAAQPPRYGMLRELMLGRPENASLLEQTRNAKRGSLILTPQSSAVEQRVPQLAPAIALKDSQPPDVKFLLHIFGLPLEELESDPQLRALRDIFSEYQNTLVSGHLAYGEQMAISVLLATPAAHRALLEAAASIARPSADEAAAHEAALISSPLLDGDENDAGHEGGRLSPTGDDANSPRRKKTRRGCRGGRRRGSKSWKPSAQLTELAELYLQSSEQSSASAAAIEVGQTDPEARENVPLVPKPSTEATTKDPLLSHSRSRSSQARPSSGPRPSAGQNSQHLRQASMSSEDRVHGSAGEPRAQDLKTRIGRRLSRAEASVLNDSVSGEHRDASSPSQGAPDASQSTPESSAGAGARNRPSMSHTKKLSNVGLGVEAATRTGSAASHSKRASVSALPHDGSTSGQRAPNARRPNSARTLEKDVTTLHEPSIADHSAMSAASNSRDIRSTRSTRGNSKDLNNWRGFDDSRRAEEASRAGEPRTAADRQKSERPASPVRKANTRIKSASSPIQAPLTAPRKEAPVTRRSTRTTRGGSRSQLGSDDEGVVAPRSEPDMPSMGTRTRSGRTVRKPART